MKRYQRFEALKYDSQKQFEFNKKLNKNRKAKPTYTQKRYINSESIYTQNVTETLINRQFKSLRKMTNTSNKDRRYLGDDFPLEVEFTRKKFHSGPDWKQLELPQEWKNVFLITKNVRTDAKKGQFSLDTVNVMKYLISRNVFQIFGSNNGFDNDLQCLSDAKSYILKLMSKKNNWKPNAKEETDLSLLIKNERYFEIPSLKRLKNYANRANKFAEATKKWKWPSNNSIKATKSSLINKNKNIKPKSTTPRSFSESSSENENETITNTTTIKNKNVCNIIIPFT